MRLVCVSISAMSKFLSVGLLAGASAIAALVPNQAEAVSLAVWGASYAHINDDPGETDFGGTSAFGIQWSSSPHGSASVLSAPTPVPAITTTATNIGGIYSGALGNLYYYAMVVAPGGPVPVSLNFTANGSLYSDNHAVSDYFVQVNSVNILDAASNDGDNNGAFTSAATFSVTTNTEFQILMHVFAVADGDAGPPVTAITFLELYFSLDPNLVAQGYSILTSQGIGNSLASATPLPAALPLFTTGLGVVGLLGWRRKRKAQAAA